MKPICPRCGKRPIILLGPTKAKGVQSSRFRCVSCKARFALRDGCEAHKVADCQAADGSVSVSWQCCEDEGTAEAEEGAYPNLALALKTHPDAVPVCPGCSPCLDLDGLTQHEGCNRLEMGVVDSVLTRDVRRRRR